MCCLMDDAPPADVFCIRMIKTREETLAHVCYGYVFSMDLLQPPSPSLMWNVLRAFVLFWKKNKLDISCLLSLLRLEHAKRTRYHYTMCPYMFMPGADISCCITRIAGEEELNPCMSPCPGS